MYYYKKYSLERIQELLTSEKVISLKAEMMLSEILKRKRNPFDTIHFIGYCVRGDFLFTNEDFKFSTPTKYDVCVIGGNATITDSTEIKILYVHGNLIVNKPLNVKILVVEGDVISNSCITTESCIIEGDFISSELKTCIDGTSQKNPFDNCHRFYGNVTIAHLSRVSCYEDYGEVIKFRIVKNLVIDQLDVHKFSFFCEGNCKIKKLSYVNKNEVTDFGCDNLEINCNISKVKNIKCSGNMSVDGTITVENLTVKGDIKSTGVVTGEKVTLYGNIDVPRIDTFNLRVYHHYPPYN